MVKSAQTMKHPTKTIVKKIGVLHHPKLEASQKLAEEIKTILANNGVEVHCGSAWNEGEIRDCAKDAELLITLGGDGTIVRAARIAAPLGVPILSVNMGRLGFLAELQPWEVHDKLPTVLDGDYWLEARLMLHAELRRAKKTIGSFEALNDVVVSRAAVARVIRVATTVNREYLTTYVADGVIVATPTGSTAYALAAGGPILDPSLRCLLMKPIAAHLTVAQALVLPSTCEVTLDVSTEYGALFTVDGQKDAPLESGDLVIVRASEHTCHLIRLRPPNYFYATLLDRLR